MEIKLSYRYNKKYNGNYDEISFIRPTTCPYCHSGVGNDPCHKGHFAGSSGNLDLFYTVTECNVCTRPFLSLYDKEDSRYKIYRIKEEFPKQITSNIFPEHIRETYPDFVSFYHQSEHAEQLGLLDICGTGYRKALEFLIKTYLITTKEEDQTTIENESLGNCISKIDNPLLKKCAQKASRLGNDQTHYRKKYANHDINDLKWYISTVVQFINLEHSANEELQPSNNQQ